MKTEELNSQSINSKLYVICRDGKSINDFLDIHNLNKSDIVIIKTASALMDIKNKKYVIIKPLPFSFLWSIRPILHMNGMINVTKKFIKKQQNY